MRINRMSLTLLQVWQKALPQVLKSEVMDRIGASNAWDYQATSILRSRSKAGRSSR